MAAALAIPCRIKQKHRRLRRRASGRTVYAYVRGNPVSLVDPDGRIPILPIIAAGGCLWAAYSGYSAVDSYLQKMAEYEAKKTAEQKSECPKDGETALKSERFQDALTRTRYGLSELGPDAFKKLVVGPAPVSAGLKSVKGGLLGIGCTGVGVALRGSGD